MRSGRLMANAWFVGAALTLVALRLMVFHLNSMRWLAPGATLADPIMWAQLAPLFVSSLALEAGTIAAAFLLWRSGRGVGLQVARALLIALLTLNVAGACTFVVLRTYAKGFQLAGLSLEETSRSVAAVASSWWGLLLLLPPSVAMALRPWRGPVLRRRERLSLLAFIAFTLAAATTLVARPTRVPSIGHSPLTLLMVRALPDVARQIPRGVAKASDWAPPGDLKQKWRHLKTVDLNVVVIVLESVRARDFFPSQAAPSLPRLEALAQHSVAFTRAYAHEPLSVKGLEALLFGVYPAPFWESLAGSPAADALESVPRRWRALGMRTGYFGYGEMGWIGERGFLHSQGFQAVAEGPELRLIDDPPGDRTLARALDRFLDEAPGARFGVFLWPHDTHLPYRLSPPAKNVHPLLSHAAYREAIGSIDALVGDVVDALERRGLADDTVVVLVADHGEAFGEHADSGLAHGDMLYEESVHIPLVLIHPTLFRGEREETIVQQKDVAATLTWLAGDRRAALNMGRSIFHERRTEAAYLLSHLDVASLRAGLRRDRWKYLFVEGVGERPSDERLYDLHADPHERQNVANLRPEVLHEMRQQLFGWFNFWEGRWKTFTTGPHADAVWVRRLLADEQPEERAKSVSAPAH